MHLKLTLYFRSALDIKIHLDSLSLNLIDFKPYLSPNLCCNKLISFILLLLLFFLYVFVCIVSTVW